MAYSNNLVNQTFKAAADLSAHQFKIVEMDANGEIGLALAGKGVGVLQNHPALAEAGTVAYQGQSKAIAGDTVAVADIVRANSGGWCIAVTSGAAHPAGMTLVGKALTSAASGGIFTVDVAMDHSDVNSGAAF